MPSNSSFKHSKRFVLFLVDQRMQDTALYIFTRLDITQECFLLEARDDAAAYAVGECNAAKYVGCYTSPEDDSVTSLNAVYVSKWKTRPTPIIHFCTELSQSTEITVSMLACRANRLQRFQLQIRPRREHGLREASACGIS